MAAISQERMETALAYLASTDESCADLRADMERAEYRAKRTKAAVFQISEGSVAERNAMAETNADTQSAYERYFEAIRNYDAVKNRRSTEEIVIETWRSLNANRRQGG